MEKVKAFDEIWEELHNEVEWGKYPSEEVIRFVARNYYRKDRPNVKILDAGCGTGAITWFLAREGFQAYGFDGSKTAVDKAITSLKNEGLSADLRVADAVEMPFETNYFNAVIDSAMLYANSTQAIRQILGECYRVLKPAGKFFSTGLFKIGMTGYGTGEKFEEHTYRELTEGALAHRGTVHFFDKEQILTLWSEVGFKNIKIDSLSRTDLNETIKIDYFFAEAEK